MELGKVRCRLGVVFMRCCKPRILLIFVAAHLSAAAIAAKPPQKPIHLGFHEIPIFLGPHEHTVESIAFSPDGRTLATGCGDSHLRLWDCATGKLKSIHSADASRGINGLAFSPDGRLIAGVGAFFGKEAVVWDTATGKIAREFDDRPRASQGNNHAGPQMFYKGQPIDFRVLQAVAFSPDGKVLATAPDGLLFHDAHSGELIASPKNPGKSIKAAVFSADGKFVATADEDRKVRLWSVPDGALAATLEGATQALSDVAISADGRCIVASSSASRSVFGRDSTPVGYLWIWDQLSGPPRKVEIGNVHVRQVAFVDNSHVLVTAGNEVLMLDLNQTASAAPRKIWTHSEEIHALSVSPDGRRLASGGLDRTVDIVEISSGTLIHRLPGICDIYSALSVSADGRRFATATLDHRFSTRRHDEDDSFGARRRKYFSGSANSGRLQTGSVQVWSLDDGQRQLSLPLVAGTQVTSVALVSNRDQLIVAGWIPDRGGMLSLWDLSSNQPVLDFEVGQAEMLSIAISPDGQSFASGDGDGNITLREIASGKVLHTHKQEHRIEALAYAADGKSLAVADSNRQIHLLELASGEWQKFRSGRSPIESLEFSPDGRWLAAGTRDPGMEIWDLQSEAPSRTLKSEADSFAVMPGFVAFSPDSRLAVCGGRGKNIAVFEVSSGKIVGELSGHAHAPTVADFLPEGRLVSGGEERTLRLWDVAQYKCQATWIALPADAAQNWREEWVGFKPSGDFVGSDSLDRLIGWQAGGEVYLGRETLGHQRRVTNLFAGADADAAAASQK